MLKRLQTWECRLNANLAMQQIVKFHHLPSYHLNLQTDKCYRSLKKENYNESRLCIMYYITPQPISWLAEYTLLYVNTVYFMESAWSIFTLFMLCHDHNNINAFLRIVFLLIVILQIVLLLGFLPAALSLHRCHGNDGSQHTDKQMWSRSGCDALIPSAGSVHKSHILKKDNFNIYHHVFWPDGLILLFIFI